MARHSDKAWIAGWDAGVIGLPNNPYKRTDYRRWFEAGRAAGKRSSADDVRQLNLRTSRQTQRTKTSQTKEGIPNVT